MSNWLFMVQFSKEPCPQHAVRNLPVSCLRDSGLIKLLHEFSLKWNWAMFSGILTSHQHSLYLCYLSHWISGYFHFFLVFKTSAYHCSFLWSERIQRLYKYGKFFFHFMFAESVRNTQSVSTFILRFWDSAHPMLVSCYRALLCLLVPQYPLCDLLWFIVRLNFLLSFYFTWPNDRRGGNEFYENLL